MPRVPRKTTGRPAWKRSKSRGFAASPIDTELTTPLPTTRRRRDGQLEANKGPAPRPPDYKREPFATHSGKNFSFYQSLSLKTSIWSPCLQCLFSFFLLFNLVFRLHGPRKSKKRGRHWEQNTALERKWL